MRVAAYTSGLSTPSARFRLRQYIPLWRQFGLETREFVGESYPPARSLILPLWLGVEMGRRCLQLIAGRHADLAFLQREFVSTLPTLESFTRRPRVLDVDDAIWLRQRFGSVDRLAANCDLVICGNSWIADHFARFTPRVEIVPTGVDTSRFVPRDPIRRGDETLVIGWVGTSGNFSYLDDIQNALRMVLEEIPWARLLIVADKRPFLPLLPPDRLIYRPWSASHEVETFHDIDVGIMPLRDSAWARGKCSFKLLQYLSCALPGVASPVGMNVEVAASGGVQLAQTEADWVESLLTLLRDPRLRLWLGAEGRVNVERNFASTVVAKRLAYLLLDIAGKSKHA